MFDIQSFEMFNESVKFVKRSKKKGAKTDTYDVIKSNVIIGQIKWSSRNRGYAFQATADCSDEIKYFVSDLMKKRRKSKSKVNESHESDLEYELIDVDRFNELLENKSEDMSDFDKIYDIILKYHLSFIDNGFNEIQKFHYTLRHQYKFGISFIGNNNRHRIYKLHDEYYLMWIENYNVNTFYLIDQLDGLESLLKYLSKS